MYSRHAIALRTQSFHFVSHRTVRRSQSGRANSYSAVTPACCYRLLDHLADGCQSRTCHPCLPAPSVRPWHQLAADDDRVSRLSIASHSAAAAAAAVIELLSSGNWRRLSCLSVGRAMLLTVTWYYTTTTTVSPINVTSAHLLPQPRPELFKSPTIRSIARSFALQCNCRNPNKPEI